MKRMHIHISVKNLDRSVEFYSALFATRPGVLKADYAKWSLEDPRVNFAISRRRVGRGLDHLGVQVESAEELAEMGRRLAPLVARTRAQEKASCCYAKSDKFWTRDPEGIAWESFHTLENIPVYGKDRRTPGWLRGLWRRARPSCRRTSCQTS